MTRDIQDVAGKARGRWSEPICWGMLGTVLTTLTSGSIVVFGCLLDVATSLIPSSPSGCAAAVALFFPPHIPADWSFVAGATVLVLGLILTLTLMRLVKHHGSTVDVARTLRGPKNGHDLQRPEQIAEPPGEAATQCVRGPSQKTKPAPSPLGLFLFTLAITISVGLTIVIHWA